jgi:hypothetical protein
MLRPRKIVVCPCFPRDLVGGGYVRVDPGDYAEV